MIARILGYLVLMVVITAIAGVVGWMNFHTPMVEALERIETERKELQSKKERGQKVRQEINGLEEEIKKTKREIVTLLKEKTKDRDVNKFLNDLEVHSQDSGIGLKQIRIHPKTQKQRYTEILMEFNVEGAYVQVYDFLTRIERDGFLNFSNSQITISGGGADRGTKVKDLKNQMTKRSDLKDVNGKPIELKVLDAETDFPRLRIQLDGRLIIIDRSHITRYEEG